MQIAVNIDRVIHELNDLAKLSDCPEPPPAVTRVVFTERDHQAREFLRVLYEAAGLSVRVDAVGNTFARWLGTRPELPAVGTGSHIDAIPFAGMYDGTVGVMGGLEAIRALQAAGFEPQRSIELVMFTSEEPTRFGVGCTGSRVMSGRLDAAELKMLVDSDGRDFDTVRRQAGFHGSISEAVLPKGHYHAWIELHIEQGPELQRAGLPIGIVTAIAAPSTLVVNVTGQGGHAGAVLMPSRNDALCGAAEMILKIEQLACESASTDLVATVGQVDVHPGAVNSIPSEVRFTIDLRDVDAANRDLVKASVETVIAGIADRRGLKANVHTLHADPPAQASAEIVQAAQNVCQDLGLPYRMMISRAYHDSLFVAEFAPIAMLFIPCRDGVSHRPDEYSSPQQIATGIEVLAHTLASLSHDGSCGK